MPAPSLSQVSGVSLRSPSVAVRSLAAVQPNHQGRQGAPPLKLYAVDAVGWLHAANHPATARSSICPTCLTMICVGASFSVASRDGSPPGPGDLDDRYEAVLRLECPIDSWTVPVPSPDPGLLREGAACPGYDAPLSRSFSAFAGENLATLDAAIWIAAPV
jgi:hypothetical protein